MLMTGLVYVNLYYNESVESFEKSNIIEKKKNIIKKSNIYEKKYNFMFPFIYYTKKINLQK